MKHFLFWAVVISALCSSCESGSDNVPPVTEQDQKTQLKSYILEDDYGLYQFIIRSFIYDTEKSYYENLAKFETHVIDKIRLQEGLSYDKEQIDLNQLTRLETETNDVLLGELNYSAEVKQAIEDLILLQITEPADYENFDAKHKRLFRTLVKINNEHNDDDNQNDKKTIAFAYGAQYNIARAILYTGAIELRRMD